MPLWEICAFASSWENFVSFVPLRETYSVLVGKLLNQLSQASKMLHVFNTHSSTFSASLCRCGKFFVPLRHCGKIFCVLRAFAVNLSVLVGKLLKPLSQVSKMLHVFNTHSSTSSASLCRCGKFFVPLRRHGKILCPSCLCGKPIVSW